MLTLLKRQIKTIMLLVVATVGGALSFFGGEPEAEAYTCAGFVCVCGNSIAGCGSTPPPSYCPPDPEADCDRLTADCGPYFQCNTWCGEECCGGTCEYPTL